MMRTDNLQLMEELKLRGMLSVYDEVIASSHKQKSSAEKTILEFLKVEKAECHLRSIRYRIFFLSSFLNRTSRFLKTQRHWPVPEGNPPRNG